MELEQLRARAGWRGLLAFLLIAGLVVGLLGSCARPTPTPQPVTIRFACLTFDEAYYRPLAEQFARDRPVRVELVPKTYDGLYKMPAGEADVLFTQSVRERQGRGEIIALDSLIGLDPSFDRPDYYPGILESLTIKGELWAIPAWLDVQVMYYNKDIFDAHGAAYPALGWTWDDFLQSALAIRDPEGKTYSYVYGWPTADPILFMLAHGGQLWDARQEPVRLTFDDPKNVEALEWFTALAHEHGVALTPEEATKALPGPSISMYNGVWTGRVGLWMDIFSSRGGGPTAGARKWPMKWGMTTIPRDVRSATWVRLDALAISSKARHPEACWQWLSFLSRQMPRDYLPARKSLVASEGFEQIVGSEAAAVARATLDSSVLYGVSFPEAYLSAWQPFDQALQDIVNERVTPEEGLARAQREAEGR